MREMGAAFGALFSRWYTDAMGKARRRQRRASGSPCAIADFSTPEIFWIADHLSPLSAWLGHIPFAFWIVGALEPREFVELGTHSGSSYFAFCQAIRGLGLTTACYAVDTWRGDEHSGFYGEEMFSNVSEYHNQLYSSFSRLVRSTFDEAVGHFPDSSIDLLHIDGLHSYQAVKHDFETWLPKLSERAVVLFHDTNVRERGFGVWQLWEELSGRYPSFHFLHSHGLGMLGVGSRLPVRINRLLAADHDLELTQRIRDQFSRLGTLMLQRLSLQESKKNLMRAEERIAELEGAAASRAARISELEKLSAALPERQAALAAANERAGNAEARLAQALGEAEDQRARLAEIEREREDAGAALARGETEAAELRSLVAEREAALAAANERAGSAETRLAQALGEAEDQRARLAEIERERDQARAALAEREAAVAAANERAGNAEARLAQALGEAEEGQRARLAEIERERDEAGAALARGEPEAVELRSLVAEREAAVAAANERAGNGMSGTYIENEKVLKDIWAKSVAKNIAMPDFELLRISGPFQSTNQFFESSFFNFSELLNMTSLNSHHDVLDYGCGLGRLAIPFSIYLQGGHYVGIDTNRVSVEHCIRAFSWNADIEFKHFDIYNKMYNRDGKAISLLGSVELPRTFDVAFLFSVFTHVLPENIDELLSFIFRALKPGGQALATFFLLNDRSLHEIEAGRATRKFPFQHGAARVDDKNVPEGAVAYFEDDILKRMAHVGFADLVIIPGGWSKAPLQFHMPHHEVIVCNRL